MAVQSVDQLEARGLKKRINPMAPSQQAGELSDANLIGGTGQGQKLRAPGTPQQPEPGYGRGGFEGALAYNDKDSNVANNVADVAAEDSRLMRLAKTEGTQYANRRGMLNSSIAAGAAQDAVLRKATEIGGQEAAQRHDASMARLGVAGQSQLAKEAFGFDTQKITQQAQEERKSAQQQYEFNTSLTAQEGQETRATNAQAARFEKQRINLQAKYDQQLATLDADTRKDLLTMEESMRTNLANLELDGAQKERMGAMVESTFQNYQDGIRSILNNTALPASERQALLKSAGALMQNQFDMLEGLYDIDLNWAEGTFDINTGKTKTGKKGGKGKTNKPGKTATTPDTFTPAGGGPGNRTREPGV